VLAIAAAENRFVDCDVPWTQADYVGSPNHLCGIPPRPGGYEAVCLVGGSFRRFRFDRSVDLETAPQKTENAHERDSNAR
jgi:hypothetical protein